MSYLKLTLLKLLRWKDSCKTKKLEIWDQIPRLGIFRQDFEENYCHIVCFFFAVAIAWDADVSSSHKEYQNILKDCLQNLVICSYIGVEISLNFV